ncbi:MAG TPA: aminoglycoside phosphotransferase family protein, partial [Micromonosporaceae bacterium]
MRWLPDRSVESLADAIRTVAPELATEPITLPGRIMQSDPVWHASTAQIGDAYVAKLAWSGPAAKRIAHEIDVLRALAGWAYVPEVVAAGTDPLLLVTRRVEGSSLFRVIDSIDRDRAGVQLAQFLAALHEPATLRRIESAPKAGDGPGYPLAAAVLSERIRPFIRPGQHATVGRWCDWADAVLAEPRPDVLVHGDLHGDNELWRRDRLLLVVDWETAGRAEAAYDLRAVLGTGPG